MRLIINLSRSSVPGYERFGASARLFNDEGKGSATLYEGVSTVESLDASKELKRRDLKLDIRKQFENSETRLLFLENGLSENNQNNLDLVTKKEVLQKEKFLKNKKYLISDSETFKFNMLIDPDKYKKILIEEIQAK